jgi:hypothetical protein
LSPKATLDRGYAIVQRAEDGRLVRAAHAVAPGDRLRMRLADGELAATVVDEETPAADGTAAAGRGRSERAPNSRARTAARSKG